MREYPKRHEVRARRQLRRLQKKLAEHGITLEEYDAALKKQGGCCAVCGRPSMKGRLRVDHCHKRNLFRGLLCEPCNLAIGLLRDDPALAHALGRYLETFEASAA